MNKKSVFSRSAVFEDAFISSIVPYGDSDCIVRFLGRTRGKCSAFYKRGLTATKRKIGHIQALSFARLELVFYSPDQMAKVQSCDLDPKSFVLASCLRKFGFGLYCAELLEKFIPEEESCEEIFDLMESFYDVLHRQEAHGSLLRAFELKLMDYCGYLPQLDLENYELVKAYDPISCSFLSQANEQSFPFSYGSLELAKNLLTKPIGEVQSDDEVCLREIGKLFFSRLRLISSNNLKSVSFLRTLKNP